MSSILNEDRRSELISKGKSGEREKGDGKTRFEKRVKSKVANTVREYNQINMNSVFKDGILTVLIPVIGETSNYKVKIKFGGFLDILRRETKRLSKVDLRTIVRALLDSFNQDDVYISCSCLHPDTKIKLLDGTEPTVQEMCQRFEAGERLYCYSVDSQGDFIPGEVEKVWVTGQTTELIEITLDNGERVQTTLDHLYMLRDGTYLPAAELQEGQSLMPLYFGNIKGYETIRYNSHKGCNSTYKMVAAYFRSDEIKEAELRAQPGDGMSYKVAIHHKDFHKENNTPENLQVMTAKEHWMYHASLCGPDRPISDRAKEISRQNAIKRNANPTPAMIEAQDAVRGVSKKESTKQRMSQARLNESPEKRAQRIQRCAYTKIEKVLRRVINQKLPLTIESYKQCRGSGDPNILKHFSSVEEAVKYFQLNHKVTSIRRIYLEAPIDVYDIKMKDEPNFLVSAGVILHNCLDFFYRFSYWATVKDINSGEPQLIPAKITNPTNNKGPGCKHVMLVLSNTVWLLKVASVINNYIKYMERYRQNDYAKIIYPAIYGKEYTQPVQLSIDDSKDETLTDDETFIDTTNEYGRTSGRFRRK